MPEHREISVLDRVQRENPKAFEALIAFFEDPPEQGQIALKIRHGKLHGAEEIRSTYAG